MAARKARKLRVDIEPPVVVEIAGHRVTFLGLNLLRSHVIVEYDIEPPLNPPGPFGPHLLILDVTDDASGERYETHWEDFCWPDIGPGRTTTRLERRPAPEAKRLRIVVRSRATPAPDVDGPQTAAGRSVARFEVALPAGHGLRWPDPPYDDDAPPAGSRGGASPPIPRSTR